MASYLDLNSAHFRFRRVYPAERLPGFQWQRGHFPPEGFSDAAVEFYQNLLRENCEQKIDTVYEKAKLLWGWRSKEMERFSFGVKTPAFIFSAEISQVEPRPSDVQLSWILKWNQLVPFTREHNVVFPEQMEEWVVPIPAAKPFAFWVERLEGIADKLGGQVMDNPRLQEVEYRSPAALNLRLQLAKGELVCSPLSPREGSWGIVLLSRQILPVLESFDND
jgi:hypothetical protein